MNILLKYKLSDFIVYQSTERRIFSLLSDKHVGVIGYFFTFGKFPNLQNPKTFNEKIQWIKLYGGIEKYTKYVDKLKVRDFISKTIGREYLVPLIGAWNSFKEIDFEKLPHQFVLKATHGSGYVFICRDKTALNIKPLKKTLTKWLSESFYQKTREIQYRDCTPKIICEKYIKDESGELTEYKIFCYDGAPRMTKVTLYRFTEQKCDIFFDLNWKKLPISYPENPSSEKMIKKPENLEKMLEIAKKLSKKFPYVRVDLISLKNKIYFGELTFTPDNGLKRFEPPEVDDQIGELIDLSKYNRFKEPDRKLG